jgi:regulator of protease activity HflC (stomatin/prohibitin superfamily)
MDKIKVIILGLFMAFVVMACTLGCSYESVNADEEGVFIKKPYLFGSEGVDPAPLLQGREICAFSTDFIVYKNNPVQYTETFEDLSTKDNNFVDLNAYITLQLIKGQSPLLHDEFGIDWYKTNIKEPFRKVLRDKLNTYDMPSLTTDRGVYIRVEDTVTAFIKNLIATKKIPVEVKLVIVGRAKPNQGVMEEIDKTAAQIQAKQTETKRGEMQDARKTAESKRAIADKAYMLEMGLTNEQFIHLRSLDIEREKVDMVRNKSNVQIDLLMTSGSTKEVIPTYDIRK